MESYLHYGDLLQPLVGVRILLLFCLLKPLTEVFQLHAQRSPREVQADPAYGPGDLLIVGDRFLNRERGHAQRGRLDQQGYVIIKLYPLRRHAFDGHSG